jgi:hypothetical protein
VRHCTRAQDGTKTHLDDLRVVRDPERHDVDRGVEVGLSCLVLEQYVHQVLGVLEEQLHLAVRHESKLILARLFLL